jgi:uncharacterized damage-inducible protein DinB
MTRPLADLYPDWPQYAARLRGAVVDLDAVSLALRAGRDHAPIWALAAHLAGSRLYWLCGVFEQPGAESTPFGDALSGFGWEDDLSHPRSGDELAWALDSTWAIIADVLARWTVDDLDKTASRMTQVGTIQAMTRASVLNRLHSHDAFHAGEISQLLGLHALPPIDLWRRPAP